MKKGIKFKLLMLFAGFVFLTGSAIGVTLWMVKSQRKDGSVINMGGLLRMSTQQMSKDALALSLGVETARAKLSKSSESFDRTLNALLNGGDTIDDSGRNVTLPPIADAGILAQMNKVKGLWDAFHKHLKVMLDPEAPIDAFTASAKYIEANNMTLLAEMGMAVDMLADSSSSKVNTLIKMQVGFFILTLAVAVVGLLILSRLILKPIHQVVGLAQAVADGDLTAADLSFKTYDEMGMLGSALNRMKGSLNGMLEDIKVTSSKVATASGKLSESSNWIVNGTEKQSAQTTLISSSMEQMRGTVTEIAKNSQNATETARVAQERAVMGGDVVEKAVSGMKTVAQTVKASSSTVEELGKSSAQIGGIVAVINDIADQTNLLALNAAIEAARAGEQGRGFAVVADEVRKLAEKTTKATKQIADMIKTIQADTKKVMAAMHEGTRQAEDGVHLANDAGEALREIVSSANGVADLIRQIATAAEEQSVTTDSIAMNIIEIANVSKETFDGMKQISVASEDLRRISDELLNIVGSFRLDNKEGAPGTPGLNVTARHGSAALSAA